MEEQEGKELHRICFACANAKQSATSASNAGTGKRKGPLLCEAGLSKRAKEKEHKLCNRLHLYVIRYAQDW